MHSTLSWLFVYCRTSMDILNLISYQTLLIMYLTINQFLKLDFHMTKVNLKSTDSLGSTAQKNKNARSCEFNALSLNANFTVIAVVVLDLKASIYRSSGRIYLHDCINNLL